MLLQTDLSAAAWSSEVDVAIIIGDLGLSTTKAVTSHVDDLGVSHCIRQAFLDLVRAGCFICGSVIVPKNWFREITDVICPEFFLNVGAT